MRGRCGGAATRRSRSAPEGSNCGSRTTRRQKASARSSTWTSSIRAGSGATRISCEARRFAPPSVSFLSTSRSARKPRRSSAATRGRPPGSSSSGRATARASRSRAFPSTRRRLDPAPPSSGPSGFRRKQGAATCACASPGPRSTRSGPSNGSSSGNDPVTDLVLLSPLPGWVMPLEEVDDEVFAARMLGDGIAIDPTDGCLRAPCDGEVTALPESAHAVTLRASNGAEILLHVGIDTVALKGRGFAAQVRSGERVKAGQPLLRFDLDALARGARSLVTPLLVTEPERFRIVDRRAPGAVRAGDALLTLRASPATAESATATGNEVAGTLRIDLAHGLHARPAAMLAQGLKRLCADATLAL